MAGQDCCEVLGATEVQDARTAWIGQVAPCVGELCSTPVAHGEREALERQDGLLRERSYGNSTSSKPHTKRTSGVPHPNSRKNARQQPTLLSRHGVLMWI